MFQNVTKEFYWKVDIELAQTFDRLGNETKTKEHIS